MKTRKNDLESGFTLIEVIITFVVLAIVVAMMAAYFGKSITQSSLPIFRLKTAARLNDVLEKITAQYSQYPQWQKNTTYAAGAIILPTTPKRTGLLYTTSSGGTSGATEPTWPLVMGGSPPPDGTITTWTTVWPTTTLPNVAAPTLASHNSWLAGRVYTTVDPVTIVYPGNGYQYIRTNTGTSGTTAPIWSSATTSGSKVTPLDGTVEWQYIGPAPTLVLKTLIGAEDTDITQTFPIDTVVSYRVIHNRFIKFVGSTGNYTEDTAALSTSDQDYGKYLKVTIGFRSDDPDRTGETLTTLFVSR